MVVIGVKALTAEFCVADWLAIEVVATRGAVKTSRVKVECEVAPAASRIVTVYVPDAVAEVGVPVISPVLVLRVSPAGRAGETE